MKKPLMYADEIDGAVSLGLSSNLNSYLLGLASMSVSVVPLPQLFVSIGSRFNRVVELLMGSLVAL